MKVLVKLFPAFVIFFASMWFIAFQFNPYSWCQDSPTDDKMYICEPFGFELTKGFIDRKPDDRFAGEERRLTRPNTKAKKAAIDCSNDNVLMTKEGYDYCVNGKR